MESHSQKKMSKSSQTEDRTYEDDGSEDSLWDHIEDKFSLANCDDESRENGDMCIEIALKKKSKWKSNGQDGDEDILNDLKLKKKIAKRNEKRQTENKKSTCNGKKLLSN